MADENTIGSASDLLVRKLVQARKAQGATIHDISAETRIHKEHLEKIESGNLTFLPAAYVYAFLKEYARSLRLEDDDLLQQCREELSIPTDRRLAQEAEAAESDMGSSQGDRLAEMFDAVTGMKSGVPAAVLIGGAAIIVLLLLLVSFFLFSGQPGNNQDGAAEVTLAPEKAVETVEEAEPVVFADSVSATEPDTLSLSVENVPEELPVMQEAWAEGVSFLPESPESPYQKILVVRVITDLTWVKVIADDGSKVYQGGRFKAGEILRYEAKKNFSVNIGRPPYVEIYLNGKKVPPLEKRTVVLGGE